MRARTVVNAAGAWADVVGQLAGAAPIGLTPCRRTASPRPEGLDLPPACPPSCRGREFLHQARRAPAAGLAANADPCTRGDVVPEEIDVATGIWLYRADDPAADPPPLAHLGRAALFVPRRRHGDRLGRPGRGLFWVAAQGGYGIRARRATRWRATLRSASRWRSLVPRRRGCRGRPGVCIRPRVCFGFDPNRAKTNIHAAAAAFMAGKSPGIAAKGRRSRLRWVCAAPRRAAVAKSARVAGIGDGAGS